MAENKFNIRDERLSRKALIALVTVLREDRALLETEIKTAWKVAVRYQLKLHRLETRNHKQKFKK